MKFIISALAFGLSSLGSISTAEPARKLNPEQLGAVREAAIDAFVRQFNTRVRVGRDLTHELPANIKPAYLRQYRSLTADLGAAPRVSRDGTTLNLDFGGDAKIAFTYPDLGVGQIRVGKVLWTFDASAPPAWQIQQLNARYLKAENGGDRSAFSRLLVPDANALFSRAAAACAKVNCMTWVGLITATSVLQGAAADVKNAVWQWNCYAIYNYTSLTPHKSIGWCREWKKDDDLMKKADRAEAVGNTDDLAKLTSWKISKDACPATVDKKGQEYGTYVGEISKDSHNDWQARSWTYVSGRTVDGEMTEAFAFKNKEDAASPNPREIALARFEYSKDLTNPVTIHFPQAKSALPTLSLVTDPGAIPVKSSDKISDIKDPGQAALATKMVYLAQATQTWVKGCISEAFNSQFEREKEAERKGLKPSDVSIGK